MMQAVNPVAREQRKERSRAARKKRLKKKMKVRTKNWS